MAGRMGALKRRLPLAILALVLAATAVYVFLLRARSVEPELTVAPATSVIGEGSDAVGVSADGSILDWTPLPEDADLPRLPISEPPPGGRLAGPLLQQARVLGAAPPALRPYVESSYYGESGVDVELASGIELRFGDDSQVEEKWRAAAAVLADPETTALDYVNLHAPRHPAIGGSAHLLPPLE